MKNLLINNRISSAELEAAMWKFIRENPAPKLSHGKQTNSCAGYWQSPDDRTHMSTQEDEWGL